MFILALIADDVSLTPRDDVLIDIDDKEPLLPTQVRRKPSLCVLWVQGDVQGGLWLQGMECLVRSRGAAVVQVPPDPANPGIWACIPPYAHPATLVPCTGMSPCQPFYFCLCKPLWITEEHFVPCLPCCDILQHKGLLCSSKIEDFWHGVLAVGSMGWGGMGLQGVLQPPGDAWSPRAALS